MNKRVRLAIVTIFMLAGLLVLAAFPLGARADGSTPPPPTDPATNSTPAPDTGSTQAVSTDPATTAVTSDTTSNSTPVPADTQVVALDSSGNPVPLATATAAVILSTGDPIWCPNGAAPSAGAGGCTPSFTNLSNLVGYLNGAQPTQNGTIWITAGTDTGGAASTNGAIQTTWSTHSLTIQGGWDGTNAGHIIGQTTLGNDLSITNWGNDISLNDLIFNGAGAIISTTGNIYVNNVEVKNRIGVGLSLTNLSGLTTSVNVTNSNFHNNTSTGLEINSSSIVGTVILKNVTASSNGALGARIITNGSVSISNSVFNSNFADGLNVSSAANINLSHVTADLNNAGGVTHAGTWLTTSHGDITIHNSEFNGNQFDGLQALASGSINADAITADQNGFLGSAFAGTYLVAGPSGDVTINTGEFNNNYADALWVQAGDSISLNQVTADYNQSLGGTHAAGYLVAGTSGNITIDSSAFSNNALDGLNALAGGSITANNLSADQNQSGSHIGAGANLTAGAHGNVTISGGSFDKNMADGLHAIAGGSVSVNGITANQNQAGAHDFAAAYLLAGSAGNVSVDNSIFNDNSWTGVLSIAGGDVSLNNVNASGNLHIGADLIAGPSGNIDVNGTYSGNGFDGLDAVAGGAITLTNTHADSNNSNGKIYGGAGLIAGGDININPDSSFSFNQWDGLHAISNKNIRLNGVTANANDHSGVVSAGTLLVSGATGLISIDNSVFNDNYHDALVAVAGGQLTLNQVKANGNQVTGSTLAGTVLNAGGPITITDSAFKDNQGDGLNVTSPAGITLSGVVADNNEQSSHITAGTVLQSNGPISIYGWFRSNKFDGLHATTTGIITMKNVTADSNNGTGANLLAGGSISIDPSSFSYNTGVGLIANAGTTISMKHVTFNGNGGDGAQLTAGTNATSYCDQYNNNGGWGVNASLPGTLRLQGDIFSGNVTGDYTISGGGTVVTDAVDCEKTNYKTPTPKPAYLTSGPTPASTPAAPTTTLNVVNVTDGQSVSLDCATHSGTTLALSNRDQIVLLCPVTGQASLKHVTTDALPGPLDSGITYQSAMDAEVTQSGQLVQTLNGPMKVDFAMPSGTQGTTQLSILHWDGTKWVDVGGTATPDGYIETITNQTGVFALVSR